jgi:hypothetical protein
VYCISKLFHNSIWAAIGSFVPWQRLRKAYVLLNTPSFLIRAKNQNSAISLPKRVMKQLLAYNERHISLL